MADTLFTLSVGLFRLVAEPSSKATPYYLDTSSIFFVVLVLLGGSALSILNGLCSALSRCLWYQYKFSVKQNYSCLVFCLDKVLQSV